MRRLRVGVIGLGVGEQHVQTYLQNPRCNVVAICDFSEEKLVLAEKQYPALYLTKNAQDLISNPDIDIISIASYDDAHADQVISALNAGKHVFVEKPLCQTLNQALQIKQVWYAQKTPLKLGCNLILREAPLYKWLKDQIQLGLFGHIYAFDGEYLYGRLQKITDGWRNNVKDYSVMEGGGIHMIDLMLWLTGQRPKTVFTAGNRLCSEGTKFHYNDFATSIMQFDSSMIGRITANFGCVHRHQHVIRIYGTEATFFYDDAGPRLHKSRDPDTTAQPINLSSRPETKGELIPALVSSILTQKTITDETQMIFDGISICAASDQAIKTQKQELIEYL
ncbi:MAG: Gfo/Idh/MocA family oxidoreductase [Bacteroidota bacterium]